MSTSLTYRNSNPSPYRKLHRNNMDIPNNPSPYRKLHRNNMDIPKKLIQINPYAQLHLTNMDISNNPSSTISPYFKRKNSSNAISPYFKRNKQITNKNSNIKNNSEIHKGIGFHGATYYSKNYPKSKRLIKLSFKEPQIFTKLSSYKNTPNTWIQQSKIQTLKNAKNYFNNRTYKNIESRFKKALQKSNLHNNILLYGINMKDLGTSITQLPNLLSNNELRITNNFLIRLLHTWRDLIYRLTEDKKTQQGHFDIWPPNVVIDMEGTVSLIDIDNSGSYTDFFNKKEASNNATLPIYFFINIPLFNDTCSITRYGRDYLDIIYSVYPIIHTLSNDTMCKLHKTAQSFYNTFKNNSTNKLNNFMLTHVIPYIDTFSLGMVFMQLFTIIQPYSESSDINPKLWKKYNEVKQLSEKMATHDITKQMTPEEALAEIKLIIEDMPSTK